MTGNGPADREPSERTRDSSVSLANDDRARVPFALVGVLLLVSAATVAAVHVPQGHVERDAALAGDRAEAATETALRDATRGAAAEAAGAPVVDPANTTFGRLLDEERPFRSYLELLVYERVRQQAGDVDATVGSARAAVDLPRIENASTAADALNRTTVEAAGTGLVRVEVRNATVVTTAGDEVVDRRERTLEATVVTPVLTMHDRTATYDRRLSAPPTERGLGRGLTGGLYALAWPRALGQRAGLPIEDVLAHRHVELVANLAAQDLQRDVFGAADRRGEHGLAVRTAEVASEELAGPEAAGLVDAALPSPNANARNRRRSSIEAATDPAEIGVNRTADLALVAFLDGESGDSLEAVLEDATTVEARLATATERRNRSVVLDEDPPDGNWTYRNSSVEESVVRVDPGGGPTPAAPEAWQRGPVETRTVVVERVVERYYVHEGNVTTTTDVTRVRYGAGIAVLDRPTAVEGVPDGPVGEGALRDAAGERAWERLVEEAGGVDDLAVRAVRGDVEAATVNVTPSTPAGLRARVASDLASTRETLREVSVTYERADLLTGAAPHHALADAVRAYRGRAVDGGYDDLEHRAVVAARAAYVDRTERLTRTRTAGVAATGQALRQELQSLSSLPSRVLDDLVGIGVDYVRPEPSPVSGPPPAGDVALAVDGSPAYLTVNSTGPGAGPETAPAGGGPAPLPPEHPAAWQGNADDPLAVRTATVASIPAEQIVRSVTDWAVDRIWGVEAEVPPLVAARTLEGMNHHPGGTEEFRRQRADLRSAVGEVGDGLRLRADRTLATETSIPAEERTAIVEDAFERFDGPAAVVLAADDGRLSTAVAEAAVAREAVDPVNRTALESRLRTDLTEALNGRGASIPAGQVAEAAGVSRDQVSAAAAETVNRAVERARISTAAVSVPRGVPIAPTPGMWVLTANAWTVELEGQYDAFRVRAPVGAPAGAGQVVYVRDGTAVERDLTGDGDPERLGNATRVSISTWTAVVVGVPAGSAGVGNLDAAPVQCSPSWDGECAGGFDIRASRSA